MEVILIRHTSVDVPPGMCYGQTDVPLKPTFEAEAAVTAENLKAYLPFDHVYTSPLTRCVRLATYCGYPVAIMKDSHIGSYGVIGLICYFLLLLQLHHLPLGLLCILVLSGDCWSKFCASQIVNYLPYARKEEDSKSKTVYNRMSWHELLAGFLCGLLPFVLLLPIKLWIATLFPLLTFFLLYRLMKRRLQGYTGDCCGATFLLCELSFYLGSLILIIN